MLSGKASTRLRTSRGAASSSRSMNHLPSVRKNQASGNRDRSLTAEHIDQHQFAIARRHARMQAAETVKRPGELTETKQ